MRIILTFIELLKVSVLQVRRFVIHLAIKLGFTIPTLVFIDPFVFDTDCFAIYNKYNYCINKFKTSDIPFILDDLFKTSSEDAARLKVKKIRN